MPDDTDIGTRWRRRYAKNARQFVHFSHQVAWDIAKENEPWAPHLSIFGTRRLLGISPSAAKLGP